MYRKNHTPLTHLNLSHTLEHRYEGFDTIHKVPSKLQWGVWAYTLAALVRPGGELWFADGHYLSWANSYSCVTSNYSSILFSCCIIYIAKWLKIIRASLDCGC